jgi:hypothetical protein
LVGVLIGTLYGIPFFPLDKSQSKLVSGRYMNEIHLKLGEL